MASDTGGRNFGDITSLVEVIAAGKIAMVETCLPGVVASFDGVADPPRVAVDLAVRGLRVAGPDTLETYRLPQLPDVPVLYPGASTVSIYWPLAVGDEVMVYFASRDTDNALETGDAASEPPTTRRHHFMDAFAVPTPWSRPGAFPADARATGLVLEHPTLIRLGKGATEKATTANKVVTFLLSLQTWIDLHTHTGGTLGGGLTGAPSTAPSPTPALGDFQAAKVEVE